MNHVSSLSRYNLGIEPLEARIAPARVILVGAPDAPNKGDYNYSEVNKPNIFQDIFTGTDDISLAIKGGIPAGGVDGMYYLKLGKGDVLKLYTGQDAADPLLTVAQGNVVAFFFDANNDNEVQQSELVSIALGKDASINLKSGVAGDIVTNLNENGTPTNLADDTLDMTSLISSKQGIKGLFIGGGDVSGKILSGGSVSNVTINGGVDSILVGTAAANVAFDFFPGLTGGDGILSTVGVTPKVGEDGGSITNVLLNDDLIGKIQASDGGFGAKGGSLTQIVLTKDTTGFTLQAGKGGDADGLTKKNGGIGGLVKNVYVAGVLEDLPSPNDLIQIVAGEGGATTFGGKGGTGGSLSSVYVGFQLVGGKPLPSADYLVDDVQIVAGAGGAGKTGGNAGSITTTKVAIATADAAGDEIQVIAGVGGLANAAGGKAGVGGSITDVDLRNVITTTGGGVPPGLGASILVQAGDGGAAGGLLGSAKGGSLTKVTLLGSDHRLIAGNGSTGKTGSDGGFIKTVQILESEGVLAHNASFQAGIGGDGTAGKGGKGGDINVLRIENGDFAVLDINPNGGGNGGNGAGTGGKGGAGGLVTAVDIVEIDTGASPAFQGTFNMNSGNGGAGSAGGGNGGAITLSTFDGDGMNAVVTAGSGGSVTALGKGNGGLGGLLSKVQVSAIGLVGGVGGTDPNAVVTSGTGGDGVGVGKGGQGGNMQSVGVRVPGSVTITAGDGGSGGATGAAGSGGSLLATAGFGTRGSGSLIAGDAGAGGLKAGNGGNIYGSGIDALSGIYAEDQVLVQAGNGTHGGSGGSLKLVGYGSTTDSLTPTPSGTISILAGNGSAEAKIAGKGGSIDNVSGSISSGNQLLTLIKAGSGGGNADKSADGGSISNLGIRLGGNNAGELFIEAGDAGTGGANVSKGGKGGSVTGVQVSDIDPSAIVRHISAGNGGDTTKLKGTGGIGGTINKVDVVDHDIGVRSGEDFGYAKMGGLFAGAGGNGAIKGISGNVSNISASAIASIVAGRNDAPEAVNLVDYIYVGTPTDLLKDSEGDINRAVGGPEYYQFVAARFATANLVGGVSDLTRVDSTKFAFTDNGAPSLGVYHPEQGDTPIDGLIFAKTYVQAHTNFTPEAIYITTAPKGENPANYPKFFDYNNLV